MSTPEHCWLAASSSVWSFGSSSSFTCLFSVKIRPKRSLQDFAHARKAGADGAYRDFERVGDLLIRHFFKRCQGDSVPELNWQGLDRFLDHFLIELIHDDVGGNFNLRAVAAGEIVGQSVIEVEILQTVIGNSLALP